MLSARVKVLLLSYQLLSFSVSRTRQFEVDNTVVMFIETETVPMPVETTAVYIMSSLLSQSRTSTSSVVVTSELSSFPVSSLHTIEVTVPLVTSTTSAMLTSTAVVPSVVTGTTEGSSDSGGVIAATVVSVLVVAGIATVIVIILVVHMQRKKKTKRRYSFTKSTETVYLNVSTTMPAQDPPCVENEDQNKEGSTLNQYTTSPASDQDSSYHIYEMAEVTDEVLGEPQESQEKRLQEASNMPDERSGTATSRLKRAAYSWGSSKSQRQKRNLKDPQRVPPRRYNTMSEYEFMRPQLQAAAANAAKKRRRIPSDEVEENPYSEIGEGKKSQQSSDQQSDKQSDNYIFMRTGRPSAQFSSFLSKWLDNINKDDTRSASSVNVNQRNQSGEDQPLSQVNEEDQPLSQVNEEDQPLSQVNEEDVYITMD